jgi:hypothetical protein
VSVKVCSSTRQFDEYFLGDIFGEMRPTTRPAQGGGIHQSEVALHHFSEGPFIVLPGIAAEEFGIG